MVRWYAVILLQIVMVSPGTHLAKNHESQSRAIECHKNYSKTRIPESLCNHRVNLKTHSKTRYYSLLKDSEIKIYSFYCQAQQRLKEICIIKQLPQEQPQKLHKQGILQKHLQTDQSIFASYGANAKNYFASLGIFMRQGCRGNKITGNG